MPFLVTFQKLAVAKGAAKDDGDMKTKGKRMAGPMLKWLKANYDELQFFSLETYMQVRRARGAARRRAAAAAARRRYSRAAPPTAAPISTRDALLMPAGRLRAGRQVQGHSVHGQHGVCQVRRERPVVLLLPRRFYGIQVLTA